MSGGGGDNRTEETPEQKELAKIAAEKWNFSQQNLAPLMDQYMEKTDQMRSPEALAYQRGRSNEEAQVNQAAQQQQISQATQNMGLDPSSGKAMMLNSQAGAAGAASAADYSARAQNEQISQHVVGLQNINAIGMGQAGQAQAGIGDIASMNARSQQQDAFNTFNRRSANMQLLGTVAGAGVNYGMQGLSTPAGTDVGSVADTSQSLHQNRIANPYAMTHTGGR